MPRFFNNPLKFYFFLSCLVNLEFILGKYRPINMHDTFDSWYVPLKTTFQNMISDGWLAWDPWALSGNPAFLKGAESFFNFFYLISGFIPLWALYSLWSILVCFVAGIGMHLYLKNILHLSFVSTVIGSLLFLILSIDADHSQVFNYAFPLFLYLFHSIFDVTYVSKSRLKYLFLLILLILNSFISITVPYFPFIHLGMIFLFSSSSRQLLSCLYGFLVVWIGYGFIHAPSLYTLLSQSADSHRMTFELSALHKLPFLISAVKTLADIIRLLPIVTIVPAGLAFLSFYKWREKKEVRMAWVLLIGVVFICVISNSWIGFFLMKNLGIFKGLSWERMYTVSVYYLFCVLAAYGCQVLEEKMKHAKILFAVFIFVSAGILFFDTYRGTWMHPGTRMVKMQFYPQMLALALIYPFLHKFKKYISVYSLFGIFIFYLIVISKYEYFSVHRYKSFHYYFGNKEMKQLSKKSQEPIRAVMYCGTWTQCHPSLLQYHGFQTAEGYQEMYPLRYQKLWIQMIDPSLPSQECAPWKDSFLKWSNRVYTPRCSKVKLGALNENLLSLFNVQYVFSETALPYPKKNMRLLFPREKRKPQKMDKHEENPFLRMMNRTIDYFNADSHYWVYEIPSVLPRSFVVHEWEMFDDEEKLLERLGKKRAQEHLNKVALFKKDLDISLDASNASVKSNTQILKYAPTYIKVKGSSDAKGILILTDQYHKNWKAWVNGEPSLVFPANYVFRGVQVPKGDFVVEFKYEDRKLQLAYGVILLGLLVLIVGTTYFSNVFNSTRR